MVAGDSSLGGAETFCPEEPDTQYLMFCWLGAVFATMVQVKGESTIRYLLQRRLLLNAVLFGMY